MASSIVRSDWLANFNLVGRPKINDYTFKIDERSEKSNWIYNSLNLGIDAGERFGVVYSEMMGGYSADNAGVIYCHGKDDDGNDDFKTQIQVDWEDRFNEDVLETVGELSFLTVGLETTNKGNTFYKKFLSAYDAIAYIKEHLTEDMVVNVRGNLKYTEYNDTVQVRKNIQSIVLSKAEPEKFRATFTQSILLDSDSTSLKADGIDKDLGVLFVNARVLDYLKEKNGVEIKGQYPYYKQFEFPMDFSNEKTCKLVMDKLFKVKKNTVTQITFEGEFIEGGATVSVTMDDVPDDIKDLIALGIYTEEEALARCSAGGNKVQRMVLKKPYIKLVGEDKVPVVQKFEEKYKEEELFIDVSKDEEIPFPIGGDEDSDEDSSDDEDGLDWLSNL